MEQEEMPWGIIAGLAVGFMIGAYMCFIWLTQVGFGCR